MNQTDFRQPPDALFLNPGRDPGLALLDEPAFFWRPRRPATILGFPAAATDETDARIRRFLTFTDRHKRFSQVVEFNSVPVVLDQAEYRKSYTRAQGRFLLSGAAGIRLQNRYCWVNRDAGEQPDAVLAEWFRLCCAVNRTVAPVTTRAPAGLAGAIDCRNTFNYYHFLTESLSQLCIIADSGVSGPIRFHFPNHPDKTRAFTAAYVEALFPDLAGRVEFVRAPFAYDEVVAAWSLNSAYFQYGDDIVAPIDALAPSRAVWQGRVATRPAQGVLSMNAVDSALVALRVRALRAIEGLDVSHLPRRFWVGREAGVARPRQMQGEDELLEMLRPFGFQRISFETLSPLEQIAIMANAEMMISNHGAGFTNMLFAGPQTCVIELGTLQTAQFRWADFWKLAHVAGCRYVSFFADYARDAALGEPSFAADGIVPVSLSRRGLAQVMAFVVTALGHRPRFTRPDQLAEAVQRLMLLGDGAGALGLLDAHHDMVRGDCDLLLLRAEAHRLRGAAEAELAALRLAFGADPGRAQTLVQIVWCARKARSSESVRWALDELRARFPDRHDDLVRNRDWLRQIAS